ncbi:acyl-CoA/acyl-ACP dehydrogenase [Pseudomonas sp. GX19020]|uniref:acyl-CoA dehydrogenase family protein n=1 Tax=Pseudomonadota TaxID=1224 RepID=UPI0008961BBF|nr:MULTISPECIES: acyl-CoA dehydrogenase family protein [Pseudomonadota]MCL4067520.1 acyl-CoA/acyl-ACP dehydrogenase [Pseudomonas sp. GX19020]SED87326.1 Acyl-CoA dehydrogenase [Rhodobacter sp. 24-YEA-8]
MDFEISEEQRLMRDNLRSFLTRECPIEYVRECDEAERFPTELYDKLAAEGWLSLPIPVEYGGMGGSCTDLVVFLEEFARHFEAGANLYYTTVVIATDALTHFATEEQKKELLPKLARGEIRFALSLSEPGSGSDAASLVTRAELDGEEWVINGQKMFCSAAQVADYILLMTRTDPEAPKHKGITMLLVPTGTKGMEIRRLKKLGLKPMDLNEIFLTDCRIPKENVIGEVNGGWMNALKTLDYERCCLTGVNVGAAQSVLEKILQYTDERKQFGQKINSFQLTKAKLADMDMEIEAARLLLYRSANLVDRGIPNNKESAMANLYSSEMYVRAALNGMRMMGGWGYLMEFDMQRHFRDSKLAEIGGGTSEILRIIIAKELTK